MQDITVKELEQRIKEADAEQLSVLERSLAADTRKGVVAALKSARKRLEASKMEAARIHQMYCFDKNSLNGCSAGLLIGLDEVGRGPLAGPLAVGGVVLDLNDEIEGLNDSKQLNAKERELVSARIKEKALFWTVCFIDADKIDSQGISASLKNAFKTAIHDAEIAGFVPGVVLLDGNPLHLDDREINVVKGDACSASIAAASIVAKTARDALMSKIHLEYPEYGFDKNKGYGTKDHIEAIKKRGLSPVHRASFCSGIVQPTLF